MLFRSICDPGETRERCPDDCGGGFVCNQESNPCGFEGSDNNCCDGLNCVDGICRNLCFGVDCNAGYSCMPPTGECIEGEVASGTGSVMVSGSSLIGDDKTIFLTELNEGDQIFTSRGNIGTIASVSDNNHATLTSSVASGGASVSAESGWDRFWRKLGPPWPYCGKGKVDGREQCDPPDYNGKTCLTVTGNRDGDLKCSKYCNIDSSGCTTQLCGNGVVDVRTSGRENYVEECDDGNNVGGDGCTADCKREGFCGNGVIEVGEECDDGNNLDGDGCSSLCRNEVTSVCGNGVIEVGEECDDGNINNGDGCSSVCQFEEYCGNGICVAMETCSSCPADCGSCPTCGNGVCDSGETCSSCPADCGPCCTQVCNASTCGQSICGTQCPPCV